MSKLTAGREIGIIRHEEIQLMVPSSLTALALSTALAAYEKDIFARAEPSFLNSRQACLDAHDFSKIEGSPLVTARAIKDK